MNINAVVEQLKIDEGFSPKSFWDNDQWTFGYGCKAPGPEARITKEEALPLLTKRTQYAIDDFYDIYAGCAMSEVREHALVNMCFNLGETKLRKFKKMNAAVRANDWERAGNEAENSLWFRQLDIKDNGKEERGERIVRELREG
jgi:GH24 family phage-related lysozyme (muramidase)